MQLDYFPANLTELVYNLLVKNMDSNFTMDMLPQSLRVLTMTGYNKPIKPGDLPPNVTYGTSIK